MEVDNMRNLRKSYIYWDLDGTLWQHKEHEVKLICKTLSIPYSIKLEEEFFYMIGEFNRHFERIRVTQSEICQIIERTMLELYTVGISGRQFLDAWSETECNVLNKDAKEVLQKFHELGKQNNVITDWLWNKQITQLRDFGILSYFEKVYSCEGYFLKKNPKSISRVIKPKEREDSIIIGDSLQCDIAFANNAGISSIWYNPRRTKNLTSFEPTFEVTSLMEVLDIIK